MYLKDRKNNYKKTIMLFKEEEHYANTTFTFLRRLRESNRSI